jgi:membrane protein required for colicin V production
LLPQFKGLAAWLEEQLPANVREHLHPDEVPDRLKNLQNVLPHVLQTPAHDTTSPAAASSAASTTH